MVPPSQWGTDRLRNKIAQEQGRRLEGPGGRTGPGIGEIWPLGAAQEGAVGETLESGGAGCARLQDDFCVSSSLLDSLLEREGGSDGKGRQLGTWRLSSKELSQLDPC
jgi:hypothetical protein